MVNKKDLFMKKYLTTQKLYPFLMVLGASILLFRTIRLMFFENGLTTLAVWVNVLTAIEMIIDATCIIFSIKWFFKHSEIDKIISLRLGAFAAIFHAFRVLIFVIGRIGPWINFDVKPEFRSSSSIDIFWVYFAGILSILGIIGVVIIWLIRKKNRKHNA
jgi:predicted ABC-type exoprotein transport system permease subunit